MRSWVSSPLCGRLAVIGVVFRRGGGVRAGDAAEVAVLEAVAVAFEADDVGVVDEAKARGFADSWRSIARNPRVAGAFGQGVGRVRRPA